MKSTRRIAGVLMLLLVCGVPAASALAASRPNVVLVLIDDMGYECVGANGSTSYRTPHLDQLASLGMRFENCHVQPLCTPTRAQLMTGLYNVRNYTRFGHLDPAQTTFAHLLKAAGYATCIAGKWQLGRDLALPGHFGFDSYCLWQLNRRPPRYANPGLEIDGKQVDYSHGEYGPDIVNQYALDFIARQTKARPFFLYYPMMLTHAPFQPTPDSPDWDPKAVGEQVNHKPKHFADMVAYSDKLIGTVVASLEAHGLRDNTLLIVLGDNGTKLGVRSRMGDRAVIGGKGTSTHAGTHVPLIVNWPGVIGPGRVSRDLVDSTDFLPTICEATGIAVPATLELDGQSFLPQLRGEQGTPRRWIYSWYARDGGAVAKTEFAMNQQFKLYRGGEFFDLSHDLDESRPLDAAAISGEAAAAHKLLLAALDQFRDARPKAFASQGESRRPNAKHRSEE